MCGRFSLLTNIQTLIERFKIEAIEYRPEPEYNIAPSQMVSVVYHDSIRKLVSMKWGLIPSWAKDSKIGSRLINARAETISEKRVFSPALKTRRCLILADGFYEWQSVGKIKRPMHIRMKSREAFAFAGLYEIWRTPTNSSVFTCSIITTTPNSLMQPIHNRMPVILRSEDEDVWLDSTVSDLGVLKGLLKKYPSQEMEAFEVSAYVNSPKNTGSECIRPIKHSLV